HDDIGEAIAVDVAAGNVDAAGEIDVKGEEGLQGCSVPTADNFHLRTAARPRGTNNVREAVVVDVADRHADAAGEDVVVRGVIRKGSEHVQGVLTGGVVNAHVRPAARVGRGDEDALGQRRPAGRGLAGIQQDADVVVVVAVVRLRRGYV